MCPFIPEGKDWIDLLSALFTPIIAAIGILIAYQQRVINKNRLKHELFEKTYPAYDNIVRFMSSLLTSKKVKKDSCFDFLDNVKTATILFDPEIKEFTDNIFTKAIELNSLQKTLESLSGKEREENIVKQEDIKNWCKNNLNNIETKFSKYVKLEY